MKVLPSPIAVDFPNGRVLWFKFDVIDLARMNAECYLQLANPAALALASRMKFDAIRRISLVKDFFVSLAETSLDKEHQLLVAGYFSAYQPLSNQEVLQLEQEMSKIRPDMRRERVIQLTNPFIELGVRRGRRQGRRWGEVELVLKQLRYSLGSLTASQEKAIRMLKLPQVEALGKALLRFTSNSDLERWLRTHAPLRAS